MKYQVKLLLLGLFFIVLQSCSKVQEVQTQPKVQVLNHQQELKLLPKPQIVKQALIHWEQKVRERPKGSNKGDSVSAWSKKIFGRDGVYWCAVYGSILCKETNSYPSIKSAQAIKFIVKNYSISAKDIITGRKEMPIPAYAVKGRKGGNHVDLIIDYDKATRTMTLIGGNVNDAVTYRKIKLNISDRFGYTHFTKVQ